MASPPSKRHAPGTSSPGTSPQGGEDSPGADVEGGDEGTSPAPSPGSRLVVPRSFSDLDPTLRPETFSDLDEKPNKRFRVGDAFGSWSARHTRLVAAYLRHSYRQDNARQSGDERAKEVPPRRVSDTVIMDTDVLNIDLSCPICLGVCSKAVTTIECLHRFCAACIEKSLRLGLKECPTCRERCPSRRFLRPDPNFDALIAVIYPDLAGWEKEETQRIEDLNRQNSANQRELRSNLKEMNNSQKLVRKQRAGKVDFTYTGPEILHTPATWPNIGVTLLRSAIGRLEHNELSMPPNSTIGNLGDYVQYKLQSKRKVDVIYRTNCGEDVILGDTLAMAMIVSGGPNQGSLRLNCSWRV